MPTRQIKSTRKARETRTTYKATKPHSISLARVNKTKSAPLHFKTKVSDTGKIELQVPLAVGTRVSVFLVPDANVSFLDMVRASETTLAFWDNPIDDAEWNNA